MESTDAPPPQDDDLVRQLLAVKRHEKPDDSYFDNFVTNFRDRQRSEMLSQSARGLLAERVSTWWWDGGSKWVYGASAVTAAAVAVGFMLNSEPKSDANPVSENNGDFHMTLPKIDPAPALPPSMPDTQANGFVPVSAQSLQEL